MSEREQDSCETCADIADMIRRAVESMGDEMPYTTSAGTMRRVADRIEAAAKREIDEIVSAVSELREGMCLHCDLQDQCADGEDGMPTTCNAMAKVNNFINRYKKVEARDECPF